MPEAVGDGIHRYPSNIIIVIIAGAGAGDLHVALECEGRGATLLFGTERANYRRWLSEIASRHACRLSSDFLRLLHPWTFTNNVLNPVRNTQLPRCLLVFRKSGVSTEETWHNLRDPPSHNQAARKGKWQVRFRCR
jgi:hypothetical protein